LSVCWQQGIFIVGFPFPQMCGDGGVATKV
jgi:hypothetical protein